MRNLVTNTIKLFPISTHERIHEFKTKRVSVNHDTVPANRLEEVSVDQVACLVFGAVSDGDDILGELGIEHGNRLVDVVDRVRDRDRDGQRSRAVDLDDLATAQFAALGHGIELRNRVLHDLIVLGGRAEADFENVAGLADIVGGHRTSPYPKGLVFRAPWDLTVL